MMAVKLLDGPAAGVYLSLSRAPTYLRVVFDRDTGKWDALDQLTDEPKPTETIHAYQIHGPAHGAFIDYTEGGRRRGRWESFCEYTACPEQPADDVMRDTERWRAWCLAEQAKQRKESPANNETAKGAETLFPAGGGGTRYA